MVSHLMTKCILTLSQTQFQQDELLARKLQAAENLRAVRPF